MGERSAYRAREGEKTGPMFRRQWYVGDSPEDIENLVRGIAENLMDSRYEDSEINSGGNALRHDLFLGRLNTALFGALYDSCFQSMVCGTPTDISNHGIYEIELIEWNHWAVNHIPVHWDSDEGETVMERQTQPLAEVWFTSGEPLEKGMEFDWLG